MALPKIYVSHSHQDNEYCQLFVNALRSKIAARGDVWYDESSLEADAMGGGVNEALASCNYFIIILSPSAVKSKWVRRELDAALDLVGKGKMKLLLPVIAEPCPVPPLLSGYLRIEHGNSPEAAADRAYQYLSMEMRTHLQVFVSHSHQDNEYCREFVEALRQQLGSDDAVWYDEHNLGWGALRAAIEREMGQRQHFIAILSPAAVASDWVNAEIDAALDLVKDGSMQTVQFVIAAPCTVPLLLRRYKRIEQPDGTSFLPAIAAARALIVIAA